MGRYGQELSARLLALRLALAGRQHQYGEIRSLRQMIEAFAIDCIFDVGANQGQYASMLRRDVGFDGIILSFEPNPDAFAILSRKSVRDRRWHVHNLALSDFDGSASFNVTAAEQFSSLETPDAEEDAVFGWRTQVTKTVAVQCRRLDGLFAALKAEHGFSRPFLKMDTQGHDRAVSEGARGIHGDLVGLQSELAFRPLYAGAPDYRAAIDRFAEAGFRPSAIFPNNKGHFPLLVEMDGVFVNARLVKD